MNSAVSIFVLCLALLFAVVPAAAEPQVGVFSPEGTVKEVRQVTARFSEPMVALGDPRAGAAAFDVTCAEAGTARWIDSRTWAYDFARDLPAGVRCAFRVRAGLAALGGETVGGRREFSFSTGGPSVKASTPFGGSRSIDEEQAFVLTLDAEPTERSVLDHVRFAVEGVSQPVSVRIVDGKEREAILKARPPRVTGAPVLVLQARQRFPHGARVTLVWGKGVAAASGVGTDADQALDFQVRQPFTVQFRCEREHRDAACLPVSPMRVDFSAPVAWEQARRIVLVGPGNRRWKAEARDEDVSALYGVAFRPLFPESAAFTVELPADLKDDAGRAVANADRYPLAVKTAAFPPLAKFAARFGIIESKAGATLPVTLRRLEPHVRARLLRADGDERSGTGFLDRLKATVFRVAPESSKELLPWLVRVGTAERDKSVFGAAGAASAARAFALPKPNGADGFEVVGIPLERPGLYVVELESPRLGASLLGKPASMYVPAAALVTNLAVHFKWGTEASLVWVTHLDDGRPARGARVTVHDCTSAVLWRGDTGADGIVRVPGLPSEQAAPSCPQSHGGSDWEQSQALLALRSGLFITAQTPDDMSFVHSAWRDGIESWRFGLGGEGPSGTVAAHTIFDRSLLRAGDTVHMKHLLRRESLRGFVLVPAAERPAKVVIRHLGSDDKHELPLAWDAAGIAESTWVIPAGARLGTWEVALMGGKSTSRWQPEGEASVTSGTFRVEEFRVPFLRATVRPPAGSQVDVTEVPLDLGVTYLAGGVAKGLPVTVRAQLTAKALPAFEDFDTFTFANGAVKEGTSRRGRGEDDDDEGGAPAPRSGPAIHQREQLTLDDTGTGRVTITRVPPAATPQELLAELEFRDPAGEVQTVSTRVPLWPATRLVGVRPESYETLGGDLKAHVAVVDLAGKAVAGAPVSVDVFERKLYSHRKRLVGGFYAYEHVQQVKRVGELCRGLTMGSGLFVCEAKAPITGHLILQASTQDPAGRRTVANTEVWVVGPDAAWWFDVRDSDRIDVIAEKRRYEPGETARLQVRSPLGAATALVTVEREGVIDAFVVPLSGKEATIQVPVKPEYAPNAFISVLVVRGRVGSLQPTAFVDLGRPAFKVGVTEVRVGWRAHELKVAVTPARAVYQVRDKASVKVSVRGADGKAPPAGAEIALAAVDEGLLELMPNASWNLLEMMMRRRAHGVSTATAQMHVVGKRHFGVKALPQGGAGGRQSTRELFDTLLLWKARVRLDERGDATVEVPLNDSLTSFRIVAVATGGVGAFGTGMATIRATQDLMVLPGVPPLVREGDRFTAEVTVRNTTARAMEVSVGGRVEGAPAPLAPHTVSVAPGAAATLEWEMTAPVGVSALRYEIEAGERGGRMDRVKVSQRVIPAVPVRAYQATLLQSGAAPLSVPVARPADAVPGRGGVDVSFRPTLTTGLDALQGWMRLYPYTCLEQQVSRAVVLRDGTLWERVSASLPAHLDGDGLLKYFPGMTAGSDTLTAYVLSITSAAGLTVPAPARERMEEGLRKFIEGKIVRGSAIPAPDLPLRKLAALEALARHGKAAPALASSIAVEPNLWPTSAVLDWWSVLERVPAMPQRARRLSEAEAVLRARLNVQGTTMGFSTGSSDRLWWLMVSNDVNAVRLVLHLVESGRWRDEIPRLVRGALARQRRGHWDLTTANAWGTVALDGFSRVFESTPVAGTSAAMLAGADKRLDWTRAPKGDMLAFPWPAAGDEVTIRHEGAGAPWVTVQTTAAIPLTAPLSSGYRITRTVTAVERRVPAAWSRGDVVRVRLSIDAQADMSWVVVDDPIPAGASHIGRGLARESSIAVQGQTHTGGVWPAFAERSQQAFRAYYAWVPKGAFSIEYTLRLNQDGDFALPPTRVEALYAPEMFGELPNARVVVRP
jgi:alpha-2-macroglobulin